MNEQNNIQPQGEQLYSKIAELIKGARQQVITQVNTALLLTYWNIGKLIIEDEQNNKLRADYGNRILKDLSKRLTKEFGKGFSVSNIQYMRRFYSKYSIQQTLSVKLSWSHYCELFALHPLSAQQATFARRSKARY